MWTVDGQLLWEIIWCNRKKLKIELQYDFAISLLGLYPKELRNLTLICKFAILSLKTPNAKAQNILSSNKMVQVDNSTFALVWRVRRAAGVLKHQIKSTLSHSIRHVKDKWCLCLDLGLTPKISHYIYTQIFQSLNPKKLLAPGLWIRDTHLYQNIFIHSSTDEHLNCSYLMFKLPWTSAHIPFVDTGWQTSWEIHKIGTNGPEDRFIFDALKLPPGMRVLPSPFRHQVQTAFLRQRPSWRCSTHLAVTWRPLGTGGTEQLSCSLAALQVFLWDRACLNLWPLFALVCIVTTENFNKARSKYLQIFSIRPWLVLSFLSMIFNKDKGLLYHDQV